MASGNAGNPQYMRAVTMATEARVQRAEMKRQLAAGRDPLPLLLGNDERWEVWARRTRVRDVLLAVPEIGDVTTDEIMVAAGLDPHGGTKLGVLAYAGRATIASLLRTALGRENEVTLDGP